MIYLNLTQPSYVMSIASSLSLANHDYKLRLISQSTQEVFDIDLGDNLSLNKNREDKWLLEIEDYSHIPVGFYNAFIVSLITGETYDSTTCKVDNPTDDKYLTTDINIKYLNDN